jgi:hypothetical protein
LIGSDKIKISSPLLAKKKKLSYIRKINKLLVVTKLGQKVQENSSKSTYDSVEQLKKLLSHGYVVNRISYPPTSDGTSSIMIDLIQPQYHEECLLTVFGKEAVALSGFVKSLLSDKKKKGEIVE